ncbi:hypothetical protein [Pseudonocardia sp. TRM90224]|uniref:hypothetical protein n=1 Tax=Pseudonocardia sp. TRM90224 TaxID=2812678 RepID=UPI001E53BF05|nr:hypothetical protein [Pseudonocardia sp. TRM90224]
MSRFTRPASLAAAVLVVAAGAGCTSSVSGAGAATPASAAPTSAAAPATPVAWVDKVCGAFLPLADAQRTAPKKDPQDTTPIKVQKISGYLGTLDTAFGATITELQAVGPAPVGGGDEVVGKLKDALTSIKMSFSDAKTKIDAADPNDEASLKEAVKPLAALATLPDPTAGLAASPELDKAAEQAPKCKAIPQPGG